MQYTSSSLVFSHLTQPECIPSSSPLHTLAVMASVTVAQIQSDATFSLFYNSGSTNTDFVECGDLLASQFPTLGSFPSFPNIEGSFVITNPDSAACGSCWQITENMTGNTIFVTVIDVSAGDDGFVLSEEAFNTLTDGQAGDLSSVDVTAVEVDASNCGL